MITFNGHTISPTIFPDGTSQVWKIPNGSLEPAPLHTVYWDFDSEAEIIHLAQLKTLLGVLYPQTPVKLVVGYLPYGRQDKEVSNTTTFALHTFANLLNAMDFSEVEIVDPHSEIAIDLINYSRPTYPKIALSEALGVTNTTCVVYPDSGASKKYTKVYGKFPISPGEYEVLLGSKVRDQLTGHITEYSLDGNPNGKTCLIVDDICDFGNTFIILSKKLKDLGAKDVFLFVSHGLFSGGFEKMGAAGIVRFFTKDGEKYGRKA